MTLQRVRVGDIGVAYRFDGPEDAPLLMMAHALGTSHRIWDAQVAALSRRYRLLRYDWRGHGETDAPPGPYTLPGLVDDAVGVMDALGIEQAHWVGISTGAMIGQGLAIHHPQRILSLTLCNTMPQASAWYRTWAEERRAVVTRDGMSAVWHMTDHLWFTDAFIAARGSAYRAVQGIFEQTDVTGYLGSISAVADLAYRDDLHRITAPTQIIAAGDDIVTPLEHSQDMHERIQGSRLDVIEGQRHFSNVEVPDQFNALLGEGLAQRIGS